MDRNKFLLSFFDPSGTGLEIGPSYNPIVPKSTGLKVETLDYATADELREKYKDNPGVDISKIEDVDFVSRGASIGETIGKSDCYDYILASHVVEHLPDLIGFLKDCEVLLKHNGLLVLVIPDKRYCFDVFQSLTGTGDLLQAHLERRTRHPPGKAFDFIAYRGLRGGAITWDASSAGALSFEFTLDQAKELFESTKMSDRYQDVHAWRFTPSSFRLIASDLAQMNFVNLKEQAFHNTIGCEFYITLSKTAPGCPVDRLSLARAVLEEQRNIFVNNPEPRVSQPPVATSSVQANSAKGRIIDFPENVRITQISDTPPIPSFFIRFRDPIDILTNNWNYIESENEASEAMVRAAGLVVVQRACSTRSRWLMKLAQSAGVPVIYETDDFMLDLPPQSGFKLREDNKTAIRAMLAAADLVICSTASLAERLSEYNRNVRVVENYAIPFRLDVIRPIREEGPHICIVNTDYFKLLDKKNELAEALRAALSRFDYRVTFLGSVDPFMTELKASFPDRVTIVSSFIPWRRTFLERVLVDHKINIALVPLEPYTYHRFKSDIKFFDFASIGVAGIFNNPEIYHRVVHKKNGFMCDGSYRGWLDGLTYFADQDARNACGEAAYQAAHERTIDDYAREMGSAMRSLLK